jgi:hypothetical protein
MVEWPHTSPWDSVGLTVKWGILSPLLVQRHAHMCAEIHTRIHVHTHTHTHMIWTHTHTSAWEGHATVGYCLLPWHCLSGVHPASLTQPHYQSGSLPDTLQLEPVIHTHTCIWAIFSISPLLFCTRQHVLYCNSTSYLTRIWRCDRTSLNF